MEQGVIRDKMIDNRRASKFGTSKDRKEDKGTPRREEGGKGHLETLIWRMVVLGVSKT